MLRDGMRPADPSDAMVKSQQQHIQELVAKNKTLEHTISKLKAAVQAEQDRAADAVAQVQARWTAERTEWREGCDSLQIAHRVAHLRTGDDLGRAQYALLEEKEALRKERLSRMQRDFRLVMFQAKELELEARNAQLERELQDAIWEKEELAEELDEYARETASVLEARCMALTEQLAEMAAEQTKAMKDKGRAEGDLSSLRAQHSTLLAASERTTKSLERTSLQLEGLQTSHDALEKKYAEAEATVASLRRQVDKWATLESRENADLEALRKARIELEVKVKQLETEKTEREAQHAAQEARAEKLQRKVDKYKESWTAHAVSSLCSHECRRHVTDAY
ncbi:hypothetical protein C2E23DRAFT_322310 [Lenzites betulinus]|nr:hypothetical protein C2E23DRAFT_322310 [Lenzites betulinus]